MTDHYATAVDADRLAMNSAREASRKWHRKAQVHATLALAEQQRIANLLEFSSSEDPWAFEAFRALADERDDFHSDIAQALRIETA